MRKDRVMIVVLGMSHGHRTVIVVCKFWETARVVINWTNGDWEVKGNEHKTHVRDVIDQFVRWYLGGTFRPNANWLMDNGDSNPGAQRKRRDYLGDLKAAKHVVLSFDGARRGNGDGAAAWILWVRNVKGEFERTSHDGKVLRDTTAMKAEREALRMGVEHLLILFPVEGKDFQFVVENESRETKYKVDTQSMRLFCLRNDHAEDVHRADANRLEEKKILSTTRPRPLRRLKAACCGGAEDWGFILSSLSTFLQTWLRCVANITVSFA